MMLGGSPSPNYKQQRPSQMGLDVGAQLAQRAQGQTGSPAGMIGRSATATGGYPGAPLATAGQPDTQPAPDPWESATKVALSEAVGRSLSTTPGSNPRIRPVGQRRQLQALGLPDKEIDLLEANDPASREG